MYTTVYIYRNTIYYVILHIQQFLQQILHLLNSPVINLTGKKLKVGKARITEGIVNGIHERWRRYEVVKIECEDMCRMNMKRTHELLEVSLKLSQFFCFSIVN